MDVSALKIISVKQANAIIGEQKVPVPGDIYLYELNTGRRFNFLSFGWLEGNKERTKSLKTYDSVPYTEIYRDMETFARELNEGKLVIKLN